MADLEVVLSWLGMTQYLDRFVQAGFNSWETLQDITEDDLELLEIGLGYRRKLQREIVNAKKMKSEYPMRTLPQRALAQMSLPQLESGIEAMQSPMQDESLEQLDVPAKRAYRHHPKADANAPERPYSAYVLFSNDVRDKLKDDNLSFPDLSRQVGVRWQGLSTEEKAYWKQMAAGPWEEYKEKVLAYQQTDRYREYRDYVDRFKAEQTSKQEARRPKLQRNRVSSAIYPTPGQTPSTQALSGSHSSISSAAVPSSSEARGPMRPPFGRLPTRVSFQDSIKSGRMQRVCDLCRRKKSRCDGQRPRCGRCAETDLDCNYTDESGSEGDRLTQLSRKLDEYARLLSRVRSQLRQEDQRIVLAVLQDQSGVRGIQLRGTGRPSPLRGKSNAPKSEQDSEEGEEEDDDEKSSTSSAESGAGSMGSTDHVNQDDFGMERTEARPRAYMGNSSDIQWIRRLHAELEEPNTGQEKTVKGTLPQLKSHFNTFFAEDMDQAVIGDQIDPFGLPIKSTADQLVSSFFTTIHLSLPVLDRTAFLRQYKLLSSTWYAETFEDRMFITMLQLVFAIGAVHAHVSGSENILDDRDHLLYSARARILAVDSGILNDVARPAQVQVFCLGAMYSLVSDRLDRSWYMTGLAIRCAQSLGMHLENVTRSMSAAEKRFQAQTWFALVALDRSLSMMTGRPSMVHDGNCTVILPSPETDRDNRQGSSSSTSQSTKDDLQAQHLSQGQTGDGSSASSGRPSPILSLLPIESAFFYYYTELASLLQDVLSNLYGPSIREEDATEILSMLEDYDERLLSWRNNISDVLKTPVAEFGGNVSLASQSTALSLFFHTTRIIINRPCVCTPALGDEADQSRPVVVRCLQSARSVMKILRNTPLSILLHHNPMWWMLLHHQKRALTIIILELAYRSEHMPSQTEELLMDAKFGVEWSAKMAKTSHSAGFTAVAMARYLQLAARRVGADPARFQFRTDFADFVMSGGTATSPSQVTPLHQQFQQQRQQRQFFEAQPTSTHQQGFNLEAAYDPSLWQAPLPGDPAFDYSQFGAGVGSSHVPFHNVPLVPSLEQQPGVGYNAAVDQSSFDRFGFDAAGRPQLTQTPGLQQQQHEQRNQRTQQYEHQYHHHHPEQSSSRAGQRMSSSHGAPPSSGVMYPGDEFIDYGD